MNNTFFLFLLLVRPRSILVVITLESNKSLNETDYQEEKNVLIKRIEDLPKEHSYEFMLFYSSAEIKWLSSKKSKKDIIDEISNKIYHQLPEGTVLNDNFLNYMETILKNLSYDSRSMIFSGGLIIDDEVSLFLSLGFLVEIVSVTGIKYVDDRVTISSSDKVIGTRTCSENIKQKKCEEGFVFSLPKNCYADYTPICQCNTESLRQYGITQKYPCSNYNVDGYCVTYCGERMSLKNERIVLLCNIKTKSWEKIAGECLCLNVINPEIDNRLCEDKSIGESCTYTCEKTNEFPKNETVRCTINGWDNQMMCVKKCPPISIKNAVEKNNAKTEYDIGDKYKVFCQSGFEKKGEDATCQITGEWTNKISCEKIVCRALEIENSEPISNSKTEYDIGDNYTVFCQSGFEKKGEDATCQITGEWTNKISCEKSQMSLKLKLYFFNGLLFIFI